MSHTPGSEDLAKRVQRELHKNKVAKLFKSAKKYGVIKAGWTAIDYMLHAATHSGWESTGISGAKGTLKSNLLMQHGLAIYNGDMQEVRKHFVTKRKQLLDLMEYAIENEIQIPWIGVDDVAAIFPKSIYFTHRKMYSKLQASWETVRTVMNNFEFSCVIKRKVASFILEDITGDIKCYKPEFLEHGDGTHEIMKSHYDYRRWMWIRNLKDPTVDRAILIAVEDIPFPASPTALRIDPEFVNGRFHAGGKEYKGLDFYENIVKLKGITKSDFTEYWNDRLELAKNSFHDFASILEEPVKAAPMTAEERSEKARKAAQARWGLKST